MQCLDTDEKRELIGKQKKIENFLTASCGLSLFYLDSLELDLGMTFLQKIAKVGILVQNKNRYIFDCE